MQLTGWSLEYVDALSMGDFNEFLQVLDGIEKANVSLVKPKG